MATAVITGTINAVNVGEKQIVAGGLTIIITLTGDTWVTVGANFDAQRQNIINGITSNQAEAFGWNATVKALEVVTAVVRTSNTVATVTLTARPTYHITHAEIIRVTIPSTALAGGVQIVATPDFSVDPASAGSAPYSTVLGTSGRYEDPRVALRNVIFRPRRTLTRMK